MSNNTFDNAVSLRMDDTSAGGRENSISINSLTTADFKDYKQNDPYSVLGVPPSYIGLLPESPFGNIDPGIVEIKPHFGGIQGGRPFGDRDPIFTGLPGIEISVGDRPSKYPLPADGVQVSGETALGELNQRIVNKAVAKVQDSMTPAEKHTLNQDSQKYAEQMKRYEQEMRSAETQMWFRGPNDWPKPPAKPQSIVKYEEAVDKEIERITKRITA